MLRKGRPRIHWDKLTRNIRQRANLSQMQLASALRVSQPSVSLWEQGLIVPTRRLRKKLEAIA